MRALIFVLAAACAVDAPATHDLSMPAVDLSSPDDLASTIDLATPDLNQGDMARSVVGIACGSTPCFTFAQFCCTGDNGKNGTCLPAQATSCGASEFDCDGPEDCPPASPICCVDNGIAQCKSDCTNVGVAIMCHVDAHCGTVHCCPAPNGSPYGLCLPQC